MPLELLVGSVNTFWFNERIVLVALVSRMEGEKSKLPPEMVEAVEGLEDSVSLEE